MTTVMIRDREGKEIESRVFVVRHGRYGRNQAHFLGPNTIAPGWFHVHCNQICEQFAQAQIQQGKEVVEEETLVHLGRELRKQGFVYVCASEAHVEWVEKTYQVHNDAVRSKGRNYEKKPSVEDLIVCLNNRELERKRIQAAEDLADAQRKKRKKSIKPALSLPLQEVDSRVQNGAITRAREALGEKP